MSGDPTGAPAYRVAHARERLAADPRVAALDLDLRMVGAEVFVTGTVSDGAQRALAASVVAEALPDLVVHNELQVAECSEPAPDASERVV